MKCDSKWLSLYLDGELSQGKRDKLERHLQICESCAERLEELKELEALAAGEKVPQVSEVYWETFSARVRNKLLLREKETGADSFWKKLKGAFQISPFRLKLAGAVATILIAAWIGRLYIDFRPASLERQLPSQNLNLPQKAAAPPETTQIPSVSFEAEKDQAKSKESVKIEADQSLSSQTVLPAAWPESRTPSFEEKSTDEASPVELPTEVVAASKPVTEKGETANLRRISTKDIEVLPVKTIDELLAIQQGFTAVPSNLSTDTAGKLPLRGGRAGEIQEPVTEKEATADLHKDTPESTNVLPAKTVDELLKAQVEAVMKANILHRGTARLPPAAETIRVAGDTISPVSAKRRQVERIEEFILSRSNDSLPDMDMALVALAQNYLDLCQLTKSNEDIQTAQKRIQEILQKYLYAETRISLNNALEQLRALERSLE